MALLKTMPDEEVMKKYLKQDVIEPIIKNHKNLLSQKFSTIKHFISEHIILLSAQSYLVKYDITVTTDTGTSELMVLRGNRISKEAAAMWQYLYEEGQKKNRHIVPIPLEYVVKDNFMLYEELTGKTLRDFDNKFSSLELVTPEIAKHLAWIHSLPSTPEVGKHTVQDEKEYWLSVIEKINEHLPKKPNWLDDMLATLHNIIIKKMETQIFTLCHNDYQASNLIYNESTGHLGVIDFGNSTIYTPSLDVATYLVHLSVMTTKHLKQNQILTLQKLFIENYLTGVTNEIAKQVLSELPLYIARVATDIIATTAVALDHTKNPYRILIPKILLPVVQEKMGLMGKEKHTIEDCLVALTK